MLGIQALVTIAATGALLIGEYWEAAVVVFLLAEFSGGYLEALTIDRTRNALRALMSLAPTTASVRRGNDIVVVAPDDVRPGEIVVVKAGEKIPVDGVVVRGEAQVNQASITGESVPASKGPGDQTFTGTINELGTIEIETKRSGEDTTLARIITLVEEAQEERAPTQQLIERFAKYYTPVIILLALIVFVITRDLLISLTLFRLHIMPGCSGLIDAHRSGFRDRQRGGPRRRCPDQGRLAPGEGGPHQHCRAGYDWHTDPGRARNGQHQGVRGAQAEDAVFKAAIAEKMSEHHLGEAIRKKVKPGLAVPDPAEFQVLPGRGVIAGYDGRKLIVGNRRLLAPSGFAPSHDVEEYVKGEEEKGSTAVFLLEDGDLLAVLSLADTIRGEAKEIVRELKHTGVKKVVMLTGDNERTARAIATRPGIDEYRADLLPEDKDSAI